MNEVILIEWQSGKLRILIIRTFIVASVLRPYAILTMQTEIP